MTADTGPRFPEVEVALDLRGPDGNVFFIIGHVRKALKRAGATTDDVQAFSDEVMASDSYDAALETVRRWVVVP